MHVHASLFHEINQSFKRKKAASPVVLILLQLWESSAHRPTQHTIYKEYYRITQAQLSSKCEITRSYSAMHRYQRTVSIFAVMAIRVNMHIHVSYMGLDLRFELKHFTLARILCYWNWLRCRPANSPDFGRSLRLCHPTKLSVCGD